MPNNDENSVFAFTYLKIAQQQRKALPRDLQSALFDIEDILCSEIDNSDERLVSLSDKSFVYMHPHPAIEITYQIDREKHIIRILDVAAPSFKVGKSLFISYSHEDKKWLAELKKWLKPLGEKNLIQVWDDDKIKSGDKWQHEIETALEQARAAVLLVSVDFIASDFIQNNELPTILDAAEKKGLKIMWIAVRPSSVGDSKLSHYQAVHMDPALSELSKPKRERKLQRIYQKIKEAVEAAN